ncbi:MAG: HlyD family efflux transporter periplasmic adaptor subunit [Roseomonas sp.]|nr:HlyD family efflux transporter periplasmic adaptor subunit [Roseomonas sp.]
MTRAALIGLVSLLLAACEQKHSAPPAPTATVEAHGNALASAKGKVDIEGGVIRLAARRDGVIAEVLVEEGARVKRGQVLALLDDATARSNLSLAEREARQAAQEREKSAVELAAAEREVMRLEPLARNETVPQQELDRARDAQALAAVAVQTALAGIDTARARQAVAAREVEERKVVAPLDGQVIQRQARPGNGVSTLNVTPLFLFAPDVPRIVRAELEEQYLGVVAPNQAAEIVLEADNTQTGRGTVLRVGRVVGARAPSDDPGEKQDNRVVEVVVSFEDAPTLLIGQRVVVRFLANTR